MKQKAPVMRICISCRKTYDREKLLKITNDHKLGIMIHKGSGRSAYICKSKKCYTDSKIKKKLKKAINTSIDNEFIDIYKMKFQIIINFPIKGI